MARLPGRGAGKRRGRDYRPAMVAPAGFVTSARRAAGVFRYSREAVSLVWDTNRTLLVLLATLTIAGGFLPAAIAWVGRAIVDGVLLAARTGAAVDQRAALGWIAT